MKKMILTALVAVSAGVVPQLMASPRDGIVAVRVEKAGTISHTEGKFYVGRISGDETVEVVARVSGTLWQVGFKEGSFVKKGDLLFHIEDTVYKENLNAAKAFLKQITVQLKHAGKEMERQKKLWASQATSETSYDNAVRSYELCRAQQMEAAAKVALMENELSYTKIYSPVDGQIGRNTFSVGNYITPGKGVMATIVKFSPAKVSFAMSETDFLRYRDRGVLSEKGLIVRRADGKIYSGKIKIAFFDNNIDAATGTIIIDLELENKDMALVPGGFVTVCFREVFDKPLTSVPVTAVMNDGKNSFCYCVAEDGKVERRTIVAGEVAGEKRAVISGLKPGETVITGGMNKVRPGSTVKPVFPVAGAKEF